MVPVREMLRLSKVLNYYDRPVYNAYMKVSLLFSGKAILLTADQDQSLYFCQYRGVNTGRKTEQPTDIYFFFCGWHLLYSIYMVIGIPGTGTAGIITTVICFQRGKIVAGVLSVIACTGWVIQTAGHAFYYKKVRH